MLGRRKKKNGMFHSYFCSAAVRNGADFEENFTLYPLAIACLRKPIYVQF